MIWNLFKNNIIGIIDFNKEPDGLWAVCCEPKVGQRVNSQWLDNFHPCNYDSAFKKADEMNRSNPSWFYYARPVMKDNL